VDLIIRDAFKSDYDSVFSLICNELGYAGLDFDKFNERMDRFSVDSSMTTMVADYEGCIVGFIGVQIERAYTLENSAILIMALAVKSEFQGKGVGSRLLEWLDDFANRNQISLIAVSSNLRRLDAHAFYESRGFSKTSYKFKKQLSL